MTEAEIEDAVDFAVVQTLNAIDAETEEEDTEILEAVIRELQLILAER